MHRKEGSSREFLPEEQARQVVDAIRTAEKDTSGEIRVHIERVCKGDPLKRAVALFNALKMYRTAARNGVLVYLAYESRKVAIIGDKGINDVVPEGFWDAAYGEMATKFREGDFAGGLCGAVRTIGRSLKEYFPYMEDDVNEQSDEISFG